MDTSSSSIQWDPKALPDQSKGVVSPACPESCLGPFHVPNMCRTPPHGGLQEATSTGSSWYEEAPAGEKLISATCILEFMSIDALIRGPWTPYTPHRMLWGTRLNAFSKSTKHIKLVGQTPTNPQGHCRECRAGPALHSWDGKPHSLSWNLNSLQYLGKIFPGRLRWDPSIIGTHPPVPFLEKGNHYPSCPVKRHCLCLPHNVAESCHPRQPHTIQRLQPQESHKSTRLERIPSLALTPGVHHQVWPST